MKKIASLNLRRLHVMESFGFLKNVERKADEIVSDGGLPDVQSADSGTDKFKTAVETFKSAVNNFDDALKDSVSVPSASTASEADAKRDTSWRNANAYLKAMCNNPQEEVATIAAEAKALFDKYGDVTSLSQTEESGALHNLFQDIELLGSDKIDKIGFSVWFEDLKTKEDTFIEAQQQRTEEKAARRVGIVGQTREEAEDAYRDFVGTVNALAQLGNSDYDAFIDHVNELINEQKTVQRSRDTNAKKDDTADDGPVVQ